VDRGEFEILDFNGRESSSAHPPPRDALPALLMKAMRLMDEASRDAA